MRKKIVDKNNKNVDYNKKANVNLIAVDVQSTKVNRIAIVNASTGILFVPAFLFTNYYRIYKTHCDIPRNLNKYHAEYTVNSVYTWIVDSRYEFFQKTYRVIRKVGYESISEFYIL